jgi:hypothetical protein
MTTEEIKKEIKRLKIAEEHADFSERLEIKDRILELEDELGISVRACGLDGDCENCGS